MFKRPRPVDSRHPPPLAPTMNSFKPRAQWSSSGSSIFLYVNLPGFYRDQIEIKKDDKTRIIQIQGQRPLSTQTKARFNEAYRVPESCDMTKLNTSFSHGLLTIEFPKVVEGEKQEKTEGRIVQRPNQEESESSLGRKKPSNEEKPVGTSQDKATPMANIEEPKTYKSVVEGKRAVPTGSRERLEQKMKEGEASPNLGRKERMKEEKVTERKGDIPQIGQQKKTVQKLKEEDARSTPPSTGKVHAKEDERKKDGDLGQNKSDRKVHAKAEKVVERKGDGEIGQKVKEVKHINPVVGNVARKADKEIVATNQAKTKLKTKERVEKLSQDVKSKHDKKDEKMVEDNVTEEEIQEVVKQKTVEEAGLAKETGDVKDNAQVDSEDTEKMVENTLESETDPLLVENGQKKTDMDPTAAGGSEGRGMHEEESQKYDLSLVNVGIAALVIMGFGAYAFVPLVKLFN